MDARLFGFHVQRGSRDFYQFLDEFFAYRGKTLLPTFQQARAFANQMNQKRDIASDPRQIVAASQINAIALIHGISQYLFRLYIQRHPDVMQNALAVLDERLGGSLEATLDKFVELFPPQPVYRGEQARAAYLNSAHDGRTNRDITLEEVLMLWLSNINPAFRPFHDLFGDDVLKVQTAYPRLTAELNAYFANVALGDAGSEQFPSGVNIIDILLEPVRLSPDSLEGQLRVLLERWSDVLGDYLYTLLTAVDVIHEDLRALGPRTFHSVDAKAETFVPRFEASAPDFEFEAFTPDREWMPNLVLLAKNAFVWLDQLSKKYQRPITTLDQIPDEELDQLRRWGFTGLWLIGLWERSTASQKIKHIMGNPDAVASAYSLVRYEIAARLGGDEACTQLRERAWKRGIRLASDMVPNHMGIDSDWLMEHPDWFLSLPYSPYPNYTFNGVNLSSDPRVGIYLEDHYYDRSDAAVVFKRVDHQTGDTRYVYHGNDGTLTPWNDTAQLNYLNPEMREAMIQVILHIAKMFPIIRFDAAMTLVKKHIQRLWFPEPGSGSGIPSRAEHGMTKAQFDQVMPEEFWREVIDRAAVEAPDTLLLAEAFWLLEGYFVRTLGMHRVYNSAFMNMMRDEENAKYRSVIKNTIEFDPEVLRRYVNFLNNPDEKTAVEQFGKGDKYFGVTLLAVTMPGLPMFGHGQIEGFAEKYGMEYYRAYWDEQVDPWLVERHERDVFPLVKKRYLFAGVDHFLLYDFYNADGSVNENVFAYSNRVGDERALVLYHNVYGDTRGFIRISSAFSVKQGDERVLVQRSLADGLALPNDADQFVVFRDHTRRLEYLRSCRELHEKGLYAELGGYQFMALIDFRLVKDTPWQPYRQLSERLGGRGVPSVDEALRELRIEPVGTPFRALVNGAMFRHLLDARPTPDAALLDEVEAKTRTLLEAAEAFAANPVMTPETEEAAAMETAGDTETIPTEGAVPADETATADGAAPASERIPVVPPIADGAAAAAEESTDIETRAHLVRLRVAALLGVTLEGLPASLAALMQDAQSDGLLWSGLLGAQFAAALGDPDMARARLDEWLLGKSIANAARELGAEDYKTGGMVAAVKLAVARPELFTPPADEGADTLLDALMLDADAQALLNVNEYEGVLWFNKEGFETLLRWMIMLAQAEGDGVQRLAMIEALYEAMAASEFRLDKLRTALTKTAG